MAYKQVLFRSEAREKILRGVNALPDAVCVTLGPRSKSGLIEKRFGSLLVELPMSRQDGATISITSSDEILVARQKARDLAVACGLSSTDQTLLATAVSELARNIVVYAGKGEIVVSRIEDGERVGVAVVARDSGPGIADLERAFQGRYSTSGGLGLGLPGVRRVMDEFEIVSTPGKGTTVTVRKWRA